MDTDKGRSSSRKTSRSHKSSSSIKDRSSSRHKSSSRSHASSGEKSKERERSSGRSPASTPDVQIVGPADAHGSLQKSQFSRSRLVDGDFRSDANGDDDLSLTSNNSFDPIELASQRTAYYGQNQQPPSQLPQPGALLIPSEAPSRGSQKLAGNSTMPHHSFATSSSASSAMSRPSSYKTSEPSSKVSKGMSSVYDDDATIMAHAVVSLGADGEVSAVKEVDVERLAQENRAFQEQLRAQNEIERARFIEENERVQREIRESFERQKEEEAEERRRQRQCMVKALIAIAVLAAIGIGAYFGTSSSSPATAVNQSPAQTAAPVNNNAPGDSCDLGQYFLQGNYQEFDGGDDQSYVVDCSLYNEGVMRRGIALAVDESTCNFMCVGRLWPKLIVPYCSNKPPGSTITITVEGDNTGSKIYIGADINAREQETYCEPPMQSGP